LEYQDTEFEWTVEKSDDRVRRSGFDFHAAVRIFKSDRFVVRHDAAHSSDAEERLIATGTLGPIFISVVYVERAQRKRIISAFEADDDDIMDYLGTYAFIEQ
jgi:uncharacterized DUF497 family protein